MKETITSSLFISILLFLPSFFPSMAYAQKTAENSAELINYQVQENSTIRFIKTKIVIKKVLDKYNSPLANSAETFTSTCIALDFDCYLLPAIAGLESSFGLYVYSNSNNPFGWGRGHTLFPNWSIAIKTVGKKLKEDYIDKGANSIEKIAPIYAESPTWALRVSYFRQIFEKEETNINFILTEKGVKL